ncbi:MAG: O-antigen ligase family protein [Bacillota bacterium]
MVSSVLLLVGALLSGGRQPRGQREPRPFRWGPALSRYGYALPFAGVAAVSAAYSPSPSLAWGSVAVLALMVIIFWLFVKDPVEPGTMPRFTRHWVFGAVVLAGAAISGFLQNRTYATTVFLGKNGLGTLLAMSLPLAHLEVLAASEPILAWAGVLLIATALLLTMSQGGWVAAVVAELALLLLGSSRMRRQVAILILVAGILASSFALWAADSRVPAYGMLLSRLDPGSSSKTERLLIWEGSWRMFRDHPWWGVGLGAFSAVYPDYRPPQSREGNVSFAHNIILNLLAETGIFGLLGFTVIVAVWLGYGLRAVRRAKGEGRELPAALVASLAAMLTHQLFDGTLWSLHIGVGFWLLGGMLWMLGRAAGGREEAVQHG